MRRIYRASGFFLLDLFINMILNLEWSIPVWIFLGLHFVFGLSLWWFAGALALWILRIWAYMMVFRWFSRIRWGGGNFPTPPRKNVNPYSCKESDYPHN